MVILAVAAGDVHGSFSWTMVLLGVVLLLANGFFVAAEIALLAARRTRVEEAAEAGDPRAVRALRALRELSVTFSGAQLGITMCSLALGAVAEPAVAALFLDLLGDSGLPPNAVVAVSITLALSIVVFLHMVVGEMAPKNLALTHAEAVAFALSRPFGWFVTVFRPLILFMNWLANLLVRAVRVEPVDEHRLVHAPDELALALAEAGEQGSIALEDASVMGAALALSSIDAGAAMTPRVDLAAVSGDTTLEAMLVLAHETGHSRFPVFHDSIDHVVGLVHVKDALIRDDEEIERTTVAEIMRPVTVVPESRDLEHLLHDMRNQRNHAVIVIDEFGGTAGLLALEDVLEELIGDIDDEFDVERHPPSVDGEDMILSGSLRRDEATRLTGVDLEGGDTETVSGWVVDQLGRLPRVGDSAVTPAGFSLRVLSLEGRRAGDIVVRGPDLPEADDGPDGPQPEVGRRP